MIRLEVTRISLDEATDVGTYDARMWLPEKNGYEMTRVEVVHDREDGWACLLERCIDGFEEVKRDGEGSVRAEGAAVA